MWRRQLITTIGRMQGAERWVEEYMYKSVDKEVKVALPLGKTLKDVHVLR